LIVDRAAGAAVDRVVDLVHRFMVDRSKGVRPDLIWVLDHDVDGQGKT
jgi:hypothetical protein